MSTELESLHNKCSQPPIMEFNGFIIRPFDPWSLWITHPDGTGMQLRMAEFMYMLDKLFQDNF